MKLDYLSWTKIGELELCGESARRRYVERERTPMGAAGTRGRIVHAAIDTMHREKWSAGQLPPWEAVRAAVAAETAAQFAGGEIVLDGVYAPLGPARGRMQLEQDAADLARLYYDRVAPHVTADTFEQDGEKIPAIEVRVEIPPSASLPVAYLGVLDLVSVENGIEDVKTKSRAPGKDEADASEQLTSYELLYRALRKEPSKGLRLVHLVKTDRRGDVSVVPQDTQRDTDDLRGFVARANRARETYEREVFLPAPADSWKCSARFCGYFDTCVFAARRKRPAT